MKSKTWNRILVLAYKRISVLAGASKSRAKFQTTPRQYANTPIRQYGFTTFYGILPAVIFLAIFSSPAHAEPGRWDRGWGADQLNRLPEGEGAWAEGVTDLQSLPYLQGYFKAPALSRVTRFDRDHVAGKKFLYCSGHRPEAGIIDAKGKVLNHWEFDISDLWPEEASWPEASFWRKVALLPDGGLLAVYETIGLIRLDKDSQLLWARRDGNHHAVRTDENGRIYTLTRRIADASWLGKDYPVYDEFVCVLDSGGKQLAEHSLLEAFRRSSYAALLKGNLRNGNDILHTNSLQILDGSHADRLPAFAKGNVLMALRNINTVAVLDPKENRIVWAMEGKASGLWNHAHHPRLLANGHMLVFDNQGGTSGFGRSRIVEFDPATGQTAWVYEGRAGSPFDSPTCGTAQRLPDGNTLITETDRGRAFIVTKDGEIVWEYINPHRAGSDSTLIATLLQMRMLN